MEITYDIKVDDAEGRGKEFLDNSIESKPKALKMLRVFRRRYPKAYLVRVVETRCREARSS
jgi:hypothetical protein